MIVFFVIHLEETSIVVAVSRGEGHAFRLITKWENLPKTCLTVGHHEKSLAEEINDPF